MKPNNHHKNDVYIILMLTIGVPSCTILPQVDLPPFVLYPILAIGILLIMIGFPAAILRLRNINR
ncbi:hypothetical protein JI667_06890 [Bacillus sp. NTK074B]|uniref:hypothetical protein n=1 Tax=Bacillus sp. NTK074B TaxID=2802174 RepID=UPI001A8D4D42|nr:hypothetical protein [Bacillus sp. NTK074B]